MLSPEDDNVPALNLHYLIEYGISVEGLQKLLNLSTTPKLDVEVLCNEGCTVLGRVVSKNPRFFNWQQNQSVERIRMAEEIISVSPRTLIQVGKRVRAS